MKSVINSNLNKKTVDFSKKKTPFLLKGRDGAGEIIVLVTDVQSFVAHAGLYTRLLRVYTILSSTEGASSIGYCVPESEWVGAPLELFGDSITLSN